MTRTTMNFSVTMMALLAAAAGCRTGGDERGERAGRGEPIEHATAADPAAERASLIARGERLVAMGGCHDCHTPLQMGPEGPSRDKSRLLSGHPEPMAMPPAPELPPGPWMAVVGATMTAWSGPWGTTFTANLTPDPETGLGRWTTADFIATIRTGRRLGKGRPILPPMPIDVLQEYTDDDLGAIFAYLQSLPPIENQVPTPLEPRTAAAPASQDGGTAVSQR
jgi:mono/diheme cytochrome c family protein